MNILVVPFYLYIREQEPTPESRTNAERRTIVTKPWATMSGIRFMKLISWGTYILFIFKREKSNHTMINFKPSTPCERHQKQVEVIKWGKKRFWWLHPPIQLFPSILRLSKKIFTFKTLLESKGSFLRFSQLPKCKDLKLYYV